MSKWIVDIHGEIEGDYELIKKYEEPQETVTEFADRCRECGKMKRCKDCKYFEYDSVAKVDGVPLIVAHEICSKWGDGCKTSEDGYCFLFEPKEEGIYAYSYPPCRYRADIPDFYRK